MAGVMDNIATVSKWWVFTKSVMLISHISRREP